MDVKSAYTVLRNALREIIDECPNPKSPYGFKVLSIAKKALEQTE